MLNELKVDLPRAESGRSALEVASHAAKDGGRIVMDSFNLVKQIEHKGRGNIVTDVDIRVEKMLMEVLREEYPEHGIITEESPSIKSTSGYTWILDPLDGTRNYASGIPVFAMNIALVQGEDVLLGVTYDPARGELFHALKGQGAYANNEPIRVSTKATVQQSVIGLDMGYNDERAKQALRLITHLWPGMQSVRVIGSAALGLAFAAAGRLDLYFHHCLYPWDIAPGILLVREAGGFITDREGGPVSLESQGAIASNEAIHADFMRLSVDYPWEGRRKHSDEE